MNDPADQATPALGDPHCSGERVAFFGGSFDPPHLGHLALARTAREALRLDCVLFAPVGAQPLKPAGSTASFSDRLAMIELAISGEPGFAVSLADAPNPAGEPNYTLDTLRILRGRLSSQARLFCLMGADSFATLRNWRGAAEIPFAASLVVASRPGQQLDDLTRFLPAGMTIAPATIEDVSPREAKDPVSSRPRSRWSGVPSVDLRSYVIFNSAGETASFYILPGLDVEISASDIRTHLRASDERAAVPRSLPAPVADYIRAHGLYR